MREILFRGKRIDNGEWAEGSLLNYRPHYEWAVIRLWDNNDGMLEMSRHDVNPSTVGQYTGLKDKNGKRIFEGDVVKVEGKACEVKYMLGQFFVGINMPVAYKRFDCEVIGNIHDNPELLEVEK